MDEHSEPECWYVMRDLKRPNAKLPAYKALREMGFDTFTPMQWVVKDNAVGGKTRECVPCIHGLLFVRSTRTALDEVVSRTDTLQYRYIKGARQTPMVVPGDEMHCFITAVSSSIECIYYRPEEITPEMLGKKVMIVGGTLDGMVGHLMMRRGSKRRRLVVQLRDLLVASVEVESGLIKMI